MAAVKALKNLPEIWLEFLFCIVAKIVAKKVPNIEKRMVTAHPFMLPSRDYL